MKKMRYRQWISGVAGEAEVLNITLEDAVTLGSDGRALLHYFTQELHRYLRKVLPEKVQLPEGTIPPRELSKKGGSTSLSVEKLARRWGAHLVLKAG